MVIHDSLQSASQSFNDTKTVAIARLYQAEETMGIHIQDFYEVYYSVAGGEQFQIDDCVYELGAGDIFFINQMESHRFSKVERRTHERIVLLIHPEYLAQLSTVQTDLSICFSSQEMPLKNKITLTEDEQKRFMFFIHKLSENRGFGQDILDRAVFASLMAFLNQVFISQCPQMTDQSPHEKGQELVRRAQIDDILAYINSNLTEDLSTPMLAAQFYLSRSYLCELFKSSTGTTINHYVTAKRISYAKDLLTDGHMVAETCNLCGFKDYSHFVKSFTRAVGVPPKKYATYARG